MSKRSLLELNHDHTPGYDHMTPKERWVDQIIRYCGSADPADLPRGVTQVGYRHHSQPSVLDRLSDARSRLTTLEAREKRIRELALGLLYGATASEAKAGRQVLAILNGDTE